MYSFLVHIVMAASSTHFRASNKLNNSFTEQNFQLIHQKNWRGRQQ